MRAVEDRQGRVGLVASHEFEQCGLIGKGLVQHLVQLGQRVGLDQLLFQRGRRFVLVIVDVIQEIGVALLQHSHIAIIVGDDARGDVELLGDLQEPFKGQ